MRKPKTSLLVLLTLLFAAFTLGFLLGSTRNRSAIVVNVPDRMLTQPAQTTEPEPETEEPTEGVSFPIDINMAGKEELMKLPGIGEVLAERIVRYRDRHGPFVEVEELVYVEGMGHKKMLEIWDLITIGG